MVPKKLRAALGQKSGRAYGQHIPGDTLSGQQVSLSSLHRWEKSGLIKRIGSRYILTHKGYENL